MLETVKKIKESFEISRVNVNGRWIELNSALAKGITE